SNTKVTESSEQTFPLDNVEVFVNNNKKTPTLGKVSKKRKRSSQNEESIAEEDGSETPRESDSVSENEKLSGESEIESYDDSDDGSYRKYPARSTTLDNKPNYSEDQYYNQFTKAFNERLYESSTKTSTNSSTGSSPNPIRTRRRLPKRKSSEKYIDYSEKAYYAKFVPEMRRMIYKNISETSPKKKTKRKKITINISDSNSDK
ncbi:4954_t:CDS:2, partial [Diversispora eburnea]